VLVLVLVIGLIPAPGVGLMLGRFVLAFLTAARLRLRVGAERSPAARTTPLLTRALVLLEGRDALSRSLPGFFVPGRDVVRPRWREIVGRAAALAVVVVRHLSLPP